MGALDMAAGRGLPERSCWERGLLGGALRRALAAALHVTRARAGHQGHREARSALKNPRLLHAASPHTSASEPLGRPGRERALRRQPRRPLPRARSQAGETLERYTPFPSSVEAERVGATAPPAPRHETCFGPGKRSWEVVPGSGLGKWSWDTRARWCPEIALWKAGLERRSEAGEVGSVIGRLGLSSE